MDQHAVRMTRRSLLSGLLASGVATLAGCTSDGHLSFLGYTTRPNYNPNYKTIYVPIFGNKAFQWSPHRGLEMELTRAVIREIEATTPMKVISDPNRADTELLGTVVLLTKNTLNRNQQNEVRDGEVVIGLELVWRDLRTQQVLSNPRKPVGIIEAEALPPFDPDNPVRPVAPELPVPVIITLSGRYLNEVGESNASAQQRACNLIAKQIVNMMECEWQLPPKAIPQP